MTTVVRKKQRGNEGGDGMDVDGAEEEGVEEGEEVEEEVEEKTVQRGVSVVELRVRKR